MGWFGDGTAAEQVKARAAGNPRIRYFGVVPHSQILAYERRASLLVNLRPTQETYTEYSFPSKTIEYMLSGTPLLTTRLKGIPDAYFDYVFTADSGRPEDLARAMRYGPDPPAGGSDEAGRKGAALYPPGEERGGADGRTSCISGRERDAMTMQHTNG